MEEESDFTGFEPHFFTTSQVGLKGPEINGISNPLLDAYNIELLCDMDIIVSCQGGDYTSKVYSQIREKNTKLYWIDAASTLRMESDSIIVLDPINNDVIQKALSTGIKNFIGGNCTVSLMLMALGGLFKENLVEWISSMTYQAASGAGANNMRELVNQMYEIGNHIKSIEAKNTETYNYSILDLDKDITDILKSEKMPVKFFGVPLAANLIPWIDKAMETGQTREEWKGFAETNKILARTENPIPIDGQCIRIGAMRCHSQAITIKLKSNLPLKQLEEIIQSSNEWVKVIPNTKEDSIKYLTPAAVSGTLTIPVGRLRKMNIGEEYLTCFTVGDQLLWGAAEPLRRILKIILNNK
jgi:aspartate-semialdehyde dehydrogenase